MPGGYGKIKSEDGTPFSAQNQPKNRGRKPKLFSALLSEFKARGIEKATPESVREAYEYLLALPLSEVIEIAGGASGLKAENDYPAILRICAFEMLGKKKMDVVTEMLDRAHGRSRSSVDLTTDGESLNNPLNGLNIKDKAYLIRKMNEAKNAGNDND